MTDPFDHDDVLATMREAKKPKEGESIDLISHIARGAQVNREMIWDLHEANQRLDDALRGIRQGALITANAISDLLGDGCAVFIEEDDDE